MTGTSHYDARLATVYDLIYQAGGKDYAAEARAIADLIRERHPAADSVLDVACGTGLHLAVFATVFAHAEGADLSEGMCAIARSRVPASVPVHTADMSTFDLGRRFGAVTCLFSSIGYLQAPAELAQAVNNLAAHTEPGGVVVIEPWFTPQQWKTGNVGRSVAVDGERQLVRMSYSTTDGPHSVMDMHYLYGQTGAGIRYWTDQHKMSLFTAEEYEQALRQAGLGQVQWLAGWAEGRDRIIAVKPGDLP